MSNPPQPELSFSQLKQMFIEGMNYAKNKFSSAFYSKHEKLCDYQISLAQKATDLTTLYNIACMDNNVFTTSFKDPKNICCGCELQYTPIQWGKNNIEWYFFYGICEDCVFNFNFFKTEIAPPEIVSKYTNNPSEAPRWTVLGGVGKISDKSWHSIQSEYIYMNYTQPTYSTFSLTGTGNNISVTLASPLPMYFTIDLQFTDTTNNKHNFSTQILAKTPPAPNFKNSCDCIFNLGSMYYSYTDTKAVSVLDGGKTSTGTAWIDHQTIKAGIFNNWYWQALQTVQSVLSPTKSPGWLWTSIQDYESGLQYMFTHSFKNNFYIDDIKLNKEISSDLLINVYKQGKTYFNPTDVTMDSSDFSMHMLETVNIPPPLNIDLPSKYHIILPGGKEVYLTIATLPNVYTGSGNSYETPAILTDVNGKQIGIGLIEANKYLTNTQFAQIKIQSCGGDPTNKDEVDLVVNGMINKQNGWQKFLAFLTVLIPLWVILLAVWFVLYNKQNRKPRLMLTLAILLLLYGLSKIMIPTPDV